MHRFHVDTAQSIQCINFSATIRATHDSHGRDKSSLSRQAMAGVFSLLD
jgi:hypothetical protein